LTIVRRSLTGTVQVYGMIDLRDHWLAMVFMLISLQPTRVRSFSKLSRTLFSKGSSVSDDLSLSTRPTTSPTDTQSRVPYFPIYYNDVYEVRLPPNHRFPMQKYRQTRDLVQQRLLKNDSTNVTTNFRVSPLATVQELETTHCPDYIQRYMSGNLTERELRNVGFPWSLQGVNRSLSSVGGTVAAAVAVVQEWKENRDDHGNYRSVIAPWSAHVAGGTHHAFRDRGEGFCVFSDIAVAANVVRQRFPDIVQKVLILDLDVHQGNGNAVLFQDEPNVFTFSIHCVSNYFSKKEQSDLDIELPEGCNDATYLSTLHYWLKRIRNEMGSEFDLIFYQAGVDVLGHDRLGRMSLTLDGVQRRNKLVYEFAQKLNVPLVITMGGGYPRTNNWEPIISAHAGMYLQAHSFLKQLSVSHLSNTNR
jgi:acetoin utilization deacetylase AcuC-like enzyme